MKSNTSNLKVMQSRYARTSTLILFAALIMVVVMALTDPVAAVAGVFLFGMGGAWGIRILMASIVKHQIEQVEAEEQRYESTVAKMRELFRKRTDARGVDADFRHYHEFWDEDNGDEFRQ